MTPDATPVLSLKDASTSYDGRAVLRGIDLEVRPSETVAVMGRSGAGKSTLLKLLYMQRPEDIALVPQAASLVEALSVFHNVYSGRLDRYSTVANLQTLVWPSAQRVSEIRDILGEVGLEAQMFQKAGTLSGGQQQRVSLARALYNGRPILLADEPVSALDRVQGSNLLKLIKARHPTAVIILHDVQQALDYADRIVVLDDGRKVVDAPASTLSAPDLIMRFGGLA
ncbi:MAG: ATP-binding cassette domain-containing protein [Hyphomicrobiales bacterium]|nr:MAG: ATP-binding cassette domain-containing protein [Hyphomicrobiales bacterium]